MKNKIVTEVNIVLRKIYGPLDYEYKQLNSLSIVQLTSEKKSYFAIGSLPEMIKKNDLFCPKCDFDLSFSSTPLIIVGNGDVLIIIRCGYCNYLIVYDIEEKAKNKIIKFLNISKELIKNEMSILDRQYIQ